MSERRINKRSRTVKENEHGTRTGYQVGCRCRPCRAAQTTYDRGRYISKKAQLDKTAVKMCEAAMQDGRRKIRKGFGMTEELRKLNDGMFHDALHKIRADHTYLVAECDRLWAENASLRVQLGAAQNENKRLQQYIEGQNEAIVEHGEYTARLQVELAAAREQK